MLLPRKYLDPNRNISEAAQGNEFAKSVYKEFHEAIEDAKLKVERGLLIDIHGYSVSKGSWYKKDKEL